MGCLCCKEDHWTERHYILLDYMRGEGYLKTVWTAFKINTNAHDCLEYEEFLALLFIALEIYDKIENGFSRQLSHNITATADTDIELGKLNLHQRQQTKIRATKLDALDKMVDSELQARGDIEKLQNIVDTIAPQLAVQFDKDGDGVFDWEEFKSMGAYLKSEYEKVTRTGSFTTAYQPPQIIDTSNNAELLQKS